jgi:hypothetical protein
VLAVMNANMVSADRRRGRTVNRLTESATRPLFQEELRPGNDEVVRWYWCPFHPTSLYGQESRNRAGLRGFGHFCTQPQIQHSRGVWRLG